MQQYAASEPFSLAYQLPPTAFQGHPAPAPGAQADTSSSGLPSYLLPTSGPQSLGAAINEAMANIPTITNLPPWLQKLHEEDIKRRQQFYVDMFPSPNHQASPATTMATPHPGPDRVPQTAYPQPPITYETHQPLLYQSPLHAPYQTALQPQKIIAQAQ
ncbi:hypothetical protein BGZ94_010241, partial [Podila epigama]